MGDVGGEAALQLAELLQLADLHPDRLGHAVEGTGQRGQLDRPGDRHPLGQVAGGQLAALAAARRTGRTTCEATKAEIRVNATASAMPPTSSVRCTTCTVPSSPASGKIRYTSKESVLVRAGAPITSAGMLCPSRAMVVYW